MEGLWFKSSKFEIEPGEDSETNPGRYGKSLANWLKVQLGSIGYETKVIPEDWGWCVKCSSQPFLLWVGCGNVDEPTGDASPAKPEQVIWHCFVKAEVPFFKKLFSKPDTSAATAKLKLEVEGLLSSDPEVQMVEEP